jgi:predicted DCC family thiol-disulfide oxidoreductase YuxK
MLLLTHLKKSLSFDDRSMALYRILIGLIVMSDVVYRWEDLTNFYTDIGLVPRVTFLSEMAMPWSFSFHLANGSYLFAVGMFTLHLLLGLMLVFGHKTRWAMLGAFIMTTSVHNRNWLVNNGGDDVLRVILFLSIFLPLNRTFSVDSALQKEKQQTTDHFSTWVLAFFFQVFAIYFVSFVLKDSDIWRKNFTAVFFSSRLDIFVTPIGIWLRDFPGIGAFITAFSIYLEWLGPLLLFGAFLFGRFWWTVRLCIVLMFIGFHFGIFLTMNIGLFTFICESMWTLFLPGPLWDRVTDHYKKKDFHKVAIYYDADCGFCQKAVRIFREFFLLREVTIAPAQDDESIYDDMKNNHSWVIVNEKGESFFHYDAFLELLRHSPPGRPFLFFFKFRPVSFIGGKIYYWVSHNRSVMGKVSQFLQYREPKKDITFLKWISEGLGAFMLVTILMWNLTTIKKFQIRAPFFQTVTRWLHLYQEWNMFAPYPKMDNVWVEIPATLSDGSEIELLTGSREVFSVKDQAFYAQIPNEHWRKFYLNMSDRHDYARYYGGFLCRKWNERNVKWVKDTTLRKMEIIVYSQPNLPDGSKGGISRKLSWRHWCFDEDYKRDNKTNP